MKRLGTPSYPLIQVQWLQATVTEINDPPARAIPTSTVGFLIRETADEIVLAQTMADTLFTSLTVIPVGAVASRKRLRTDGGYQ